MAVVLKIDQSTSNGRSGDLTQYWTDCAETLTVPPGRLSELTGRSAPLNSIVIPLNREDVPAKFLLETSL